VFGQVSNILKRLRSSMQANLFTMKIRNVNLKLQHNYYETYGTGTRPLSGEIPSLDRLSQESSQPDGRVQVLQDSKHTDDSFRGKTNS